MFYKQLQPDLRTSQNFIRRQTRQVFPYSFLSGRLLFNRNCEERMKHLSKVEISVIKARIKRGDKYSEIASDYRINQGRIADLKFERIHADVPAADLAT